MASCVFYLLEKDLLTQVGFYLYFQIDGELTKYELKNMEMKDQIFKNQK